MVADWMTWMSGVQARVEQALDTCLPASNIVPQRLHEAMRYAVLGGGKRVRPLLVFAAGELTGANIEAVEIVASALECIHVYSLVHDDMPCMDDDILRRGKPTVHVEYDEATALLVGDALQTQAFCLLAEHLPQLKPEVRLELIKILAHAAGSRGMAGGQAIDLAAVGKSMSRAELEVMHVHKTGALIRASVLCGALCGHLQEGPRNVLDHYAKTVGLLFQVVDDILDTQSDTATLGKTAGKDAMANKPTYVSVLGLSESKRFAEELAERANVSLAELGAGAYRLRELTDYIMNRSF